MKQGIAIIAACSVLILGGCGAVGVLEAENTELQSKVDSLARVQYAMKDRVGYLEDENIKLDSRNKQLRERLTESGSLAPSEYTITEESTRYADPVQVVSVPQYAQPQQQSLTVQTYPPGYEKSGDQQVYNQQAITPQPIPPNPGAAQWRAEPQAVQSGAADVRPDAQDNWRPSTNPRGYTYKDDAQPSTGGYTYKENGQPSTGGYTYKENGQPSTGGYTYKEGNQPSTGGGYQYKAGQHAASSDQQANWNYNKPQSGQYDRDYARKFDERQPATNSWTDNRNAAPQQPRQVPMPQARVAPAQPATSAQATYERQALPPQATYERQAHPPQVYMPPTQDRPQMSSLPSDRVNAKRSDVARNADYSYLAKYQKGLDAYKERDYAESIRILTKLAAASPVNSSSDNCDFWIAEAYYALNDYNSARVYYSRVTSYPRSDKADEARARLRQIP